MVAGLNPPVKRKILSAIPDDSRDLIVKRYKMNTPKRFFCLSSEQPPKIQHRNFYRTGSSKAN